MKTMDESTESKDCAITATVPPKAKKLKQARLPFQNLGSPISPNASSNKKRKHTSPSPTTFRSPKIVKITSKENSERAQQISTKIDDSSNEAIVVTETSLENSSDVNASDGSPSREKKLESKTHDKPGAIEKFLMQRKIPKDEAKKNSPIVLLTRCDDSEKNVVETSSNAVDVDEKPGTSRNDETSNDELAVTLDETDTDNDEPERSKSEVTSDEDDDEPPDDDSDRVATTSDDDNDERKTSDNRDNPEKSSNEMEIEKTPKSGVKTEGGIMSKKKLTPKQLKMKINSSKIREEREKLKLEREKKREEERLNRQKEREARQREKKEKEEADKELKRKEREQKELKKQMEIEQKQKDKERRDRAKEEDRRKREEAKEEEKRKKEEEKLETERRKQKAASTFVSFFVPKKTETKTIEDEKIVATSNFMPFEVKADMRVAPICRRTLDDSERIKFDKLCVDKTERTDLYVVEIKKNRTNLGKSGKTWPPESKEDEIIVVEEDDVGSCNMVDENNTVVDKHRAKLLAFAENRRPPYWGTWRKRSSAVTPRRPFSKDTKWFDYEVDSDEEWEEEEPGESLRGSDDEKDEENPDDNEYDVDNEFMVPHGYLSDEEAQADEDEEDMSPETQKLKLKVLGAEFEEERKTKTSKIKPRVIGPIWQLSDNSYPENVPQKLVDFLASRRAWIRESPIILRPNENNSSSTVENSSTTKTNSNPNDERRGAKKTKLPTEALPELIRLIHGNPHGLHFLMKEFMTFWNRKYRGNDMPLSKSSILKKIREFGKRMACPEEGPMHLRACWYVSKDTRKQYLGDENLTIPNNWSYALTPKRKTNVEIPEMVEKCEKEDKERKTVPLITQYTKIITHEEMKKQLTIKPSSQTSSSSSVSSPSTTNKPSTSQSKPGKRATLISVARGEQFPKSTIIEAFARPPTSVGKIDSKVVDGAKPSTTEPVVIDLDSDQSD